MKKLMYGSLGFLSLLGFVGVFTDQKLFLSYFAFIVDFQYFFKKTDEMVDEYMCKSARNGFYAGMISVAIISLVNMISKNTYNALNLGILYGWAIAVITHALSTMYFEVKERRALQHDNE